MKTYCCGQNAEKERLAKKWERIKALNVLDKRVTLIAKTYLDEIEQIPRVVARQDGSLALQWGEYNGIVTLIFQSNESHKDSLFFNNISYTPVTIEKVKELISVI